MFSKGVRVWGQKCATMCESICALHVQTIREEVGQCVHQVDMFKGEFTSLIEELDYKCNIPKHKIGPKQTGRLQATDVKFAKMMKDTGRDVKRHLRRAQRQRAKEEGVAAKLTSGMFEFDT